MQPIEYIINSNASLFGLKFIDWVDGKPVFSEPSENAIKEAKKDLELFTERQEAIYKRTKITCGDWVQLKDGTFSRVTVLYDNQIQIGGSENGSYHISKGGTCSYSGGCGDIVEKIKLKKTTRYKNGLCWIFSQEWTGAHRGVNNILEFKIWKEI